MARFQNVVVTGDDSGVIKVWDMREPLRPVYTFEEQEDYISDFELHPQHNTLLATSADGTLGVYNFQAGKLQALSECQDDELLSLCTLKSGKKTVVGTQEGTLGIFSWADWGDVTDRFPGHPQSIDTMVKIDEDTLCTGSSDGIIRYAIINQELSNLVADSISFCLASCCCCCLQNRTNPTQQTPWRCWRA
jgi:WD repeat-containing protein 55